MHGGIISISAPNANQVNGIHMWRGTSPGSLAHTPGTAFVLNTGATTTPVRLRDDSAGNGEIQSPFLWQSGANPPHASNKVNVLLSQDGQDVFVETDCDATGNCASGGTQPHTLIYAEGECGAANP